MKLIPSASAPAAAPRPMASSLTCSSSAKPLEAVFPARPTVSPRKSPTASRPSTASKIAIPAESAERWPAGVRKGIEDFGVPWHVTRLGCRAEYLFAKQAPRNGTEAHDAMDFDLERFLHLYAMNRGILLTPFHNMALMSPQTEAGDIDRHTQVFRSGLQELVA